MIRNTFRTDVGDLQIGKTEHTSVQKPMDDHSDDALITIKTRSLIIELDGELDDYDDESLDSISDSIESEFGVVSSGWDYVEPPEEGGD